jgi:hypothetical protein
MMPINGVIVLTTSGENSSLTSGIVSHMTGNTVMMKTVIDSILSRVIVNSPRKTDYRFVLVLGPGLSDAAAY